ncbi:MAG: translation initiation factor IF-2 [Deltaproteobacteria bacterium]|nr:translation initiation factor IF-2 [Deltaproteobacteria bacterium]MBW2393916.1 translation initiation factor IF-2 [Deltaproteobacteria bacterium]
MANVRAYKIAEELGIERNEFVEKANAIGIVLKNAMASVDPEQAEVLRDKLGAKKSDRITEARVQARGGTAVIRRRKKKAPEPEAPVAEVAPEPVAEVAPPVAEAEVAPAAEPEESAEAGEPTEEAAPQIDEPVQPAVSPAPVSRPSPGPGPSPARPASDGAPRRPAQSGAETGPAAARTARQRKQAKEVVNLREQEQIARQVTSRTTGRHVAADLRVISNPRRRRRDAPSVKPKVAQAKQEAKVVRVPGDISVGELAKQLGAKAAQVQGKLMALGTMVAVNQTVDVATAEQVAKEFGFEVQDVGFQEQDFLDAKSESTEGSLQPRPVVVTVMGHVDHGKTSLLDALRQTDVVSGEAGGITQHIGAYQVTLPEGTMTFIDTPGHAAFTAMRARGAQATDLVILVIAAGEGIMPQTIEAIDHSHAAGVPIVVAVNKCDLPDANPQVARQRLMEHNVVVEDFGGEVLAIDISATKKTNLDKLLEAVLLQTELIDPKADPTVRAKGVVLESELDKGRGPVATLLIQEGTLKRGDVLVVGTHFGKVRTMMNDKGEVLKEAPPSTPVQVVGLSGVPNAGDVGHVVENERVAKEIVSHREDQARKRAGPPKRPRVNLEDLFAQAEGGGPQELPTIIKADTQGSAEAIRESLMKLPTDKVKLNVLHASVGGITEKDVQLAEASGAIIVGFHVRPDVKARKAAESSGVDVRIYKIIYEVVDEIKAAMAGLLPPMIKEKVLGQAEVRETFTIPKVGTIAGSYITDGLMRRNANCRLVRDGVLVFEGKFASLKRFKDDAREVQTGFECGIGIEGFNDVKIGDVIEAYELEEHAAEL